MPGEMLHLEILPAGQREFWEETAGRLPDDLVLYGGTAIALRYGHRQSVDFDFFTARPLDDGAREDIKSRISERHPIESVTRDTPNNLELRVRSGEDIVKLSFFGGLRNGRFGEPMKLPGKPAIASPVDLMATKLNALYKRGEPKDYIDVECLIRNGTGLEQGYAALKGMFGREINTADIGKALVWFDDGILDRALSPETQDFLRRAAGQARPDVPALERLDDSLAPDQVDSSHGRAPLRIGDIRSQEGLAAGREIVESLTRETPEGLMAHLWASRQALSELPRKGARVPSQIVQANELTTGLRFIEREFRRRGIDLPPDPSRHPPPVQKRDRGQDR